MKTWKNIRIREYWDFPRCVIAEANDELYFFYSYFDESIDDYTDHYEVYKIPQLKKEELNGSWVDLEKQAIEILPNIGLKELPFSILGDNIIDECSKSKNDE